jgi:DNA-binding CsgD family transcriptional regulator
MYNEKTERPAVPDSMTEVEQTCLRRTAEGLRQDAIGRELRMTPREVEVLLSLAQRKLGAANIMQAVARYLTLDMAGAGIR